jgi:predicted Zn-dependent peptidase
VAHLVEHLLFKGSAHRGARALAEAMDALGGQFNAYTTREFTCFHALTLNEGLAGALELLAEIVTSPALDPEDFVRERAVVLAATAWAAHQERRPQSPSPAPRSDRRSLESVPVFDNEGGSPRTV